jgi:hypothetical protein
VPLIIGGIGVGAGVVVGLGVGLGVGLAVGVGLGVGVEVVAVQPAAMTADTATAARSFTALNIDPLLRKARHQGIAGEPAGTRS